MKEGPAQVSMYRFSPIHVNWPLRVALCTLLCASGTLLQGQTSVRRVKVLGSKDVVEIEVEGSDRLVPQTRVLTGPDRFVVDLPNAVPGSELRSQSVNRGEVKDVRVGLFQSKPPVTRIVLDLKSAQSYQVFPYGRSVMIKVVSGVAAAAAAAPDAAAGVDEFPPEAATRPGLVAANYTTGAERVQVEAPPKPALDVSFRHGLLAIQANKATLSEVLFAVQQRTGAQVAIAAGAEQEKVVVDLGPAPAPEVIARLLNGSRFNFLILSAANNPQQLDRVILSPRTDGGGAMPLAPVRNDDVQDDENNQLPPGQPHAGPPPPVVPQSQPEIKAPPDDDGPEQ